MNAMTGIRAQTSENPSHSIAKASGVSAFFISTQGLYIGRIYNQIKEKPLAIIQNSIDRSSKKSYSEADAALQIEVIWLGKEKVGDSGLG